MGDGVVCAYLMAWDRTPADYPVGTRGIASAVVDGLLYGAKSTTLRRYDPATDAWTTLANPPDRAFALGGSYSSRFYILGGQDGSDYQPNGRYYDPATDTYTAITDMPGGKRQGMAGAFIGSTWYVAGGEGNAGSGTRLEAFDAVGNSWTTKTAMPTSRAFPAGVAYNGYLYVVGGSGSSAVLERYDPAGNSWTSLTSMNHGRQAPSVGVIGTKMYVAGGRAGGGNTGVDYFEVYDFATDTWTDLSSTDPVPSPGRGESAFGVIGSALYVAAGYNSSGADETAHDRYVVAGGWTVGRVRW